ncbi:hypothetical protein [Georgenia subflava]|uniref:O-antigen ligase domain-containing protein n=1 Tax=Georgenia subflava TaxID=1622177 RepID=A0A6N7EGR0_9MICO|nr:hypothetical protein [Georgenia subflava]MPV36581.1 hypothetical protein [Georgenia subflava]
MTTQQLDRTALAPEPAVRAFTMKPFLLFLTCLLLVVSSVAWRRGTFYEGGIDAVVVAKAVLTTAAAVLALLMRRPPGAWAKMRAAPVLWLGAYLLISVVGGVINADGLPAVVLAGRLALLAFTLVLITVSYPWHAVISALSSAMLLLALVGAATGVASVTATGRLYGGIPPLNANAICLLVSVPVIVLTWKAVHGAASRLELAALVPLLGLIWLTGSRTGLAVLICVLALLLVAARQVPALVVGAVALAGAAVVFVGALTPYIAAYVGRGNLAELSTLNSRTVAWRAALDYADTLSEQVVGNGLALKQIPVTALYRNEQILDSSWVSALIQVGYAGSVILLLFVLATLLRAFRLPLPERLLIGALALLVTLVSVLESGLFDTAPAFIIFFTTALLAHRVVDPPGDAVGARPASSTD